MFKHILFLPSTPVFVYSIVFFNSYKTLFAYEHPFFGVFVLHSIHGKKIKCTYLTKLTPLFHQLEVLKPLKIIKTDTKKLKNNTRIITPNALTALHATLEKLAIAWC
jgi:hypothetical protein